MTYTIEVAVDDLTKLHDLGAGVLSVEFAGHDGQNIFDRAMIDSLSATVDEARREKPRVLLLETPHRHFAMGAKLDDIQAMSDADYIDYVDEEYALFDKVENLDCITVVALPGYCIGNGAELALAFDFRVAADSLRFGLPETAVGFIAPAQRLSAYLGIAAARDLLLSGRLLKAEEAQSLQLVTSVAPIDELNAAARSFSSEWAERAPVAMAYTKRAIRAAYARPTVAKVYERAGAFRTYKSEDFAEGATAILEKRPAEFQGR